MGCLNSKGQFSHYFANLHLSGDCNRSCYFCIGQHMMALDALNNLDKWPLLNIEEFISTCQEFGITEVNVTGTNTEPLLYQHTAKLRSYLNEQIPNLLFGVRSNGVLVEKRSEIWKLYDKASITLCSTDPAIYKAMMGQGTPPSIERILEASTHMRSVKVNVVLGPENLDTGDIFRTIEHCEKAGIKRINLREPYGQPHIGDPLAKAGWKEAGRRLGMPYYAYGNCEVTHWDVHYVEVESVNLYANGNVSVTYPITKGHIPGDGGVVREQDKFPGGRVQKQWLGTQS